MQDLPLFIAHHLALTYALVSILVLLSILEAVRFRRSNFRIDITSAIQMINHQNAAIIDIRPNDLFTKGHILNAISLSNQDLLGNSKKIEKFKKRPIILVCSNGLDSQKVAMLLVKQGYTIHVLSGGIRAWNEAGMPLIKD